MTSLLCVFFFFNDTATTEIYTLSLHDALPISFRAKALIRVEQQDAVLGDDADHHNQAHERRDVERRSGDRKSTRLNSSHGYISYAVFCLKKKKNKVH